MPEFLAPGVFVEESADRAHSIDGVSTATTAFIGPTRFGPVHLAPGVLTSLAEFERIYDPFGAGRVLRFADSGMAPNFLWHAARAFFEEGGKRLYVCRIFKPLAGRFAPIDDDAAVAPMAGSSHADGCARVDPAKTGGVGIRARWPGAIGALRVRVALTSGANVLIAAAPGDATTWRGLGDLDLVRVRTPHTADRLCIAHWHAERGVWLLEAETAGPAATPGSRLEAGDLAAGSTAHVVTLAVRLRSADGSHEFAAWSGLPVDPRHRSAGELDSVFARFASALPAQDGQPEPPLVVAFDATRVTTAFDVVAALRLHPGAASAPPSGVVREAHVDHVLRGGHDCIRPTAADLGGGDRADSGLVLGLVQLEAIDDIGLVAAPGSTWRGAASDDSLGESVQALLIAHATKMRDRVALLDSAPGQDLAAVLAMRAKLDSKNAALYYPWVSIADPISGRKTDLPPSGFVAGICARVDIERGVWKPPANEVVRLAVGFERPISQVEQSQLNPEGVNCLRSFDGRGLRLWGARTLSSDPEWKYLNVRRYFAYLERSIEKGTQWVVFEPNGERLWARLRAAVEAFLHGEWRSGALLGDRTDKAFFVRCDRTTMTQNDLDNGRLTCLVGVAPIKPAEFVIFRIGQWTADAND